MALDDTKDPNGAEPQTPSNEGKENPDLPQDPPLTLPSGEIDDEAPYGRKADGTPRAKPGRKGGGSNSPEATSAQRVRLESVTQAPPRRQPPPTITPVTAIVRDYEPVARAAATLWFSVPQMFLGEEWGPVEIKGPDGKPDPNSEVIVIKNAFKDYFESKGVSDLPPGVILAVALTGYTMSRVTKPTVKSRLANGIQWIKSKTKR